MHKLVQHFNKVSIMQYLTPGKNPNFILTTSKLCWIPARVFAQHSLRCKHNTRRNCLFPPFLQGSFNTATDDQFSLVQGKTKLVKIFSPFFPKA